MKTQTSKWIEAAKILIEDSNHKILCPECQRGYLVIKDEPIPSSDEMIDRYLICDNCGKWNVITMKNLERKKQID